MADLDLNRLIEELATAIREKITQPPAPPAAISAGKTGAGSPLSRSIDHTLLKPDATAKDIDLLCQEARAHRFATVCVNAGRIAQVARLLEGSEVLPISVVGFPLGATTTSTKVFETRESIRLGAREVDMVIDIGRLKDQDYAAVFNDIREVVAAAAPHPVKVILETSLLNSEQKIIASVLSQMAGAAFVKTSTGFSGGGATLEDVSLMRRIVGPKMGVKASGGVRNRGDAEKMIAAGASRIGTSAGVAIVQEKPSSKPDASY